MPDPTPNAPKERHSFWTTLPGILTSMAGVLAAIAAVLAIFVTPDSSDSSGSEGPTRVEWARKANHICDEAVETLRHLPPTRPNAPRNFTRNMPIFAEGVREMVDDLRSLPVPAEDAQAIDHLISIFEAEANKGDAVSLAYREDIPASFRKGVEQLHRLTREAKHVGRDLGVSTCTQTITFVGYGR